MTPLLTLARWHEDFRGLLTGSVYAAPPSARTEAARALTGAGMGVHVDMMAESEGLPDGVTLAELRQISGAVKTSAVDVHLIGSNCFVDDALCGILPMRPAKIFLPWHAFTAERARAVRAVSSSAWITLWDEWDGISAPAWPAPPDGVLIMLIEPGTRGRSRLERLEIVTVCAKEMPVIVDGGITEDIAPLCVRAGVQSMVVGRALLATPEHRKEA